MLWTEGGWARVTSQSRWECTVCLTIIFIVFQRDIFCISLPCSLVFLLSLLQPSSRTEAASARFNRVHHFARSKAWSGWNREGFKSPSSVSIHFQCLMLLTLLGKHHTQHKKYFMGFACRKYFVYLHLEIASFHEFSCNGKSCLKLGRYFC